METADSDDPYVMIQGDDGYGATIRSRLAELLEYAKAESRAHARKERLWSRMGTMLGFGGAIGAGIGGVGGITSISRAGPPNAWLQIGLVVITLLGAALSAAAGTVRAPERAEAARITHSQLEAFARRLTALMTVDLPSSNGAKQRVILEASLRSLEEIGGVQLPSALEDLIQNAALPQESYLKASADQRPGQSRKSARLPAQKRVTVSGKRGSTGPGSSSATSRGPAPEPPAHGDNEA
jgi:hypothetical protein